MHDQQLRVDACEAGCRPFRTREEGSRPLREDTGVEQHIDDRGDRVDFGRRRAVASEIELS